MNESSIFGISVRALIAYTLVVAVCIMQATGHVVAEPLYTLTVMGVSFYLGKSNNPTDAKNVIVDSTVTTKSVPDALLKSSTAADTKLPLGGTNVQIP